MPPASPPRRKAGRWRSCTASVWRWHASLPWHSPTTDTPRSYAPRTSYAFYKEHLDTLCKNLKGVEAASVAYADSLSKAAQARIELRKASDQAGQRSASIAEEQKRVQSQLSDLSGAIQAAHAEVLRQEKVLAVAVQKLQNEVHNAEGIGIMDFIKIAGSVSAPENAQDIKGIVKAVAAVGSGLKDAWDKGEAAQYKVNRLGILGEDTKSLSDAFKSNGSMITQADPHVYKLLASRKALEAEMKQYYGYVKADEVRDDMRKVVDLTLLRNQLILDYNGLAGVWSICRRKPTR